MRVSPDLSVCSSRGSLRPRAAPSHAAADLHATGRALGLRPQATPSPWTPAQPLCFGPCGGPHLRGQRPRPPGVRALGVPVPCSFPRVWRSLVSGPCGCCSFPGSGGPWRGCGPVAAPWLQVASSSVAAALAACEFGADRCRGEAPCPGPGRPARSAEEIPSFSWQVLGGGRGFRKEGERVQSRGLIGGAAGACWPA